MYSRRDHAKKPWKNLNSFSKAIKNVFTHLTSFPSSPSKASDKPKSFYCPINSRYECPSDYHSRLREERSRQSEAGFSQQQHHKTAEEIQLHGEENDACAILLKNLQQVDDNAVDADVSDVDERAEEFIKQFREQLRNSNSKFSYEN